MTSENCQLYSFASCSGAAGHVPDAGVPCGLRTPELTSYVSHHHPELVQQLPACTGLELRKPFASFPKQTRQVDEELIRYSNLDLLV